MKHIREYITEGMQKFLVNQKRQNNSEEFASRFRLWDKNGQSDIWECDSFTTIRDVCTVRLDAKYEAVNKYITDSFNADEITSGFILTDENDVQLWEGNGVLAIKCVRLDNDKCIVSIIIKTLKCNEN